MAAPYQLTVQMQQLRERGGRDGKNQRHADILCHGKNIAAMGNKRT
ncbi:MAG: hypothetical protein UH734_08610 [Ruminococcus sp.]|nr:hypothetical protein [Ruminococcus sp.]